VPWCNRLSQSNICSLPNIVHHTHCLGGWQASSLLLPYAYTCSGKVFSSLLKDHASHPSLISSSIFPTSTSSSLPYVHVINVVLSYPIENLYHAREDKDIHTSTPRLTTRSPSLALFSFSPTHGRISPSILQLYGIQCSVVAQLR
jgi:hypothetical protein